MRRSTEEIAEIERHKYFLSEKRGHDVGWEFAEEDWERHHADQWRRERTGAATHCEGSPATTTCCQESASVDVEQRPQAAETEVHETVIRKDAAGPTPERGALRWLFSRLFSQQTS